MSTNTFHSLTMCKSTWIEKSSPQDNIDLLFHRNSIGPSLLWHSNWSRTFSPFPMMTFRFLLDRLGDLLVSRSSYLISISESTWNWRLDFRTVQVFGAVELGTVGRFKVLSILRQLEHDLGDAVDKVSPGFTFEQTLV